MAARENQGYLVAVIILVILVLCLGLSTFLADAGRRQSAESLKTTQEKLAGSEAVLESYRGKALILEALVGGIDVGPSVAEVDGILQGIKQTEAKPNLDTNSKQTVAGIRQKVEDINDLYKKDMSGAAEIAGGEKGESLTWRSRIKTLTVLVAKKTNDNKTTVEKRKIMQERLRRKLRKQMMSLLKPRSRCKI